MCYSKKQKKSQASILLVARCAVEALERRVHLSYSNRGKVSVIVDYSMAPELTAELAQYKQDLIADGWTVSMHDGVQHPAAPRMNDEQNVWVNFDPTPHPVPATTAQYRADVQTVKDMIAADATDANHPLNAVVIVGHVTVPYSGATSYDTHGARAMPTDQYYADLNGTASNWGDLIRDVSYGPNDVPGGDKSWQFTWNVPQDGRFDANVAPDGLEVSFGRIDMANLGLSFSSSEEDLLKSYFHRDHNYRTATFRPENKVLMQTDFFPQASPGFVEVFGNANVVGDAGDGVQYWLDHFDPQFATYDPTHYLFASRTGNGEGSSTPPNEGHPFGSSNFGDAPDVNPYYGHHNTPLQAVFTMVGGSYMGDWNNRSWVGTNPVGVPLPRSLIAANFQDESSGEALVSMSLYEAVYGEAFDAAAKGLIFPAVLEGDTVGEGFRQALNLFDNDHAIYQELLGDPTLRLTYVKPVDTSSSPVKETIDLSNGHATIEWSASGDAGLSGFQGYNVYRASSLDGTFTKVNPGLPLQSLNFTDMNPAGQYVYMVRAIRTTHLGIGDSYENASAGVFPATIILQGRSTDDNVSLKRITDGESDMIGLWEDLSIIGDPAYRFDAATMSTMEFHGDGDNDALTLDFADGSPVPAGGTTFDGGAGDDYLIVLGTSGADTATFAAVSGGSPASVTMNGSVITESDAPKLIEFDGRLGGDAIDVAGGVTVAFTNLQEVASLQLHSNTGTIDLGENDMLIRAAAGLSYGAVASSIVAARNGGAWDQPGITSTSAKTNAQHDTTLGVLTGAQYTGADFDGLGFASGDVLVKYTWYGDTDFNGRVNFDDYVRIDNGFNNHLSGWLNGDATLNGQVNFDDYVLIDLAFNNQNGTLRPGEGESGNGSGWAQVAQLDHFPMEGYKQYLIDKMAELGIYLTDQDFFPG